MADAALKERGDGDNDNATLVEVLLGDIQDTFIKREANKVEPVDRIPSEDLVKALVAIEGRPWAEMGKARKPMTQNRLARMLKPLAIVPDSVRMDEKRTPKSYYFHQFKDAFARYLRVEGASQPQHRNKADEMGTSAGFQSATAEPVVAVRKCEKSANDGACCGVAVQDAHPYPGDEPRLSRRRIQELADWYADQRHQRQCEDRLNTPELDAELRMILREEVAFPEHVEIEFERVMQAVFAI